MFDSDGKAVSRRLLLHLLKEAQYSELTASLESKIIHGVFYKQCQEEGWDTSGSHAWLLDGRVQAQTEALIMAAQEGVILIRAYRSRVMGRAVLLVCRVCKGSAETIGHLLSSCVPLQWTLYKERHDRVLYQIVRMLAAKYGIVLPDDLKWGLAGWKGVGVLNGRDLKLVIDVSVPTDRQLSATRSDLIVYSWCTKRISILEVACAWELLVIVREKEKSGKYQEFARDLATQHQGWKVSVYPLVVGNLASLAGFREELWKTHHLTKREISFLARNCQFEALCFVVRIIRRHLSNE